MDGVELEGLEFSQYNPPIYGPMTQQDFKRYNYLTKQLAWSIDNNLSVMPKYYKEELNKLSKKYGYRLVIGLVDNNAISKSKIAIDLNDKVPFVSQFSLERPNVACCRASQKTLKDFGLDNSGLKSDRIITAKENLNHTKLDVTNNAKDGVDYINQQLESGNPVMVGVDHTLGKGQSDGTASDHYVVITGRGYDTSKKQTYFTFYEVGTSHEEKGKSDKNRLYVQKDNSIKGTNYAGKRKFTVVEVRKNKTKK
ncbi:hypothetical protein NHF50_00100 [Flavobacterium sp. NRK F10]|nr:hypothetical protein [Flavobacterium sp. NRK F10]